MFGQAARDFPARPAKGGTGHVGYRQEKGIAPDVNEEREGDTENEQEQLEIVLGIVPIHPGGDEETDDRAAEVSIVADIAAVGFESEEGIEQVTDAINPARNGDGHKAGVNARARKQK